MEWKGHVLNTGGEFTDAIADIVERGDGVEAERFLDAYKQVNHYAESNIGYWLGYLPHDQMVKGLQLFEVSHPIFGSADRAAEITPTHALKLGMEWGEALKRSAPKGEDHEVEVLGEEED